MRKILQRLTAGVHQFAYTCIQEHAVWDNQQFWEAAFFHDVHRQIRRLYLPAREESDCPFPLKEVCNVSYFFIQGLKKTAAEITFYKR